MTRRTLLFYTAALPAFSKQRDDLNFPDWNGSTVERLLTDSPWAKEWEATIDVPVEKNAVTTSFAQLGMDLPRLPRIPQTTPSEPRIPTVPSDGPWAVRTAVSVIARWASALPVRRASALQQFGRHGLNDERAVELLNGTPDAYVLELAGLPRNVAGKGPDEIRKQLMRTAKVFIAGRRPLTPVSVTVPSYGRTVTASIRFPRQANVTPEDGNLDLSAEVGEVRLTERFKLRSMLYEGQLEI